ncbi:MAG: redox-sensing transcriptional repressor Rex, partial [Gemmataceae bacterium]
GVLTVPASAVQNMATTLVEAGVKGLLNFAPEPIKVPMDVSVVHVDLAMELEHLAFLVHLNDPGP